MNAINELVEKMRIEILSHVKTLPDGEFLCPENDLGEFLYNRFGENGISAVRFDTKRLDYSALGATEIPTLMLFVLHRENGSFRLWVEKGEFYLEDTTGKPGERIAFIDKPISEIVESDLEFTYAKFCETFA